MRKVIFSMLVFLALINVTRGQEANYFDSPFGGGIGYIPGWVLPNLDGMNEQLKPLGIPGLGKNGFFTSGGSGFLYLGFVKNTRIGGMWFKGSTTEKAFAGGFRREASYTLSAGAFSIEYTLPVFKDVGVSVGALIGGGTQSFEIYQSRFPADWDNIWKEFSDPSGSTRDISRRLENSFLLLSPTLNIDVPIYRFLSFRVGAGYLMQFGESWKVDNEREIKNVPEGLSKNSFYIQTGIFIGFFSF